MSRRQQAEGSVTRVLAVRKRQRRRAFMARHETRILCALHRR